MAKSRNNDNILHFPDMSDVEVSSGGGIHIPEGEYKMECVDVKIAVAKLTKNEMYVWRFKITEGAHKGKMLTLNTVLTEAARWKLRQTAEAFGIYQDGEFDVDADTLKGTEVIGQVLDREYAPTPGQTRTVSNLDTVKAIEEDEPEQRASRADKTNGKATGKRLPNRSAAEVEDMSADELEDLVEKYGLAKVDLSKLPTLKRKAASVVSALSAAGKLDE